MASMDTLICAGWNAYLHAASFLGCREGGRESVGVG